MERKRVGQSRGGSQTLSLVLPAWGLAQPPAQSIHAPRPRLPAAAAHSGAPARYPPAPLPPLLGRESGSWRPRILPPGPASCASHPSARDPPEGGAAVGRSGKQCPPALGRLPPGPRRSLGNSLPDTAAPRAFARDWLGSRTARGAAGAGRGVVWSPSNRGTPRETPLRNYAVTHRGGAEASPH